MGNWNLCIQGIGCHHNPDYAKDADRMAKEFVLKLLEAGHTVEVAHFTAGSKTDVKPLPIRVGDTVRLNSGGPDMKVTRIGNPRATCRWPTESEFLAEDEFPLACLTRVGGE